MKENLNKKNSIKGNNLFLTNKCQIDWGKNHIKIIHADFSKNVFFYFKYFEWI